MEGEGFAWVVCGYGVVGVVTIKGARGAGRTKGWGAGGRGGVHMVRVRMRTGVVRTGMVGAAVDVVVDLEWVGCGLVGLGVRAWERGFCLTRERTGWWDGVQILECGVMLASSMMLTPRMMLASRVFPEARVVLASRTRMILEAHMMLASRILLEARMMRTSLRWRPKRRRSVHVPNYSHVPTTKKVPFG